MCTLRDLTVGGMLVAPFSAVKILYRKVMTYQSLYNPSRRTSTICQFNQLRDYPVLYCSPMDDANTASDDVKVWIYSFQSLFLGYATLVAIWNCGVGIIILTRTYLLQKLARKVYTTYRHSLAYRFLLVYDQHDPKILQKMILLKAFRKSSLKMV